MNAQLMTREERTERLRHLRAREAARKLTTTRGRLLDRPLLDQISFVLFDPGAITPRGDNYGEPLWRWQARAISYLLNEPEPPLNITPVPAPAVSAAGELLNRVADMANPAKPEVSYFGDHGPAVADWLRMVGAGLARESGQVTA